MYISISGNKKEIKGINQKNILNGHIDANVIEKHINPNNCSKG